MRIHMRMRTWQGSKTAIGIACVSKSGRQRLAPYPFDIDHAARPIAASVLLTLKLSYSKPNDARSAHDRRGVKREATTLIAQACAQDDAAHPRRRASELWLGQRLVIFLWMQEVEMRRS